MGVLSGKEKRRLGRAIAALCKPKAYLASNEVTVDMMRQLFGREIKLSSGHERYPNQAGLDHLRDITSTLHEADVFDGVAVYSDVWQALKECVGEAVSRGQVVSTFEDLLSRVSARIHKDVCKRWFLIAVRGVDMGATRSLSLGELRLTVPTRELAATMGVEDPDGWVAEHRKRMGRFPWLYGSFVGSRAAASKRFEAQARLALGMLAIAAAATHDNGAHRFGIAGIFSASEHSTSCTSLSWEDGAQWMSLTTHLPHVQEYEVSHPTAQALMQSLGFISALEIFEKEAPTEFEAAVKRAVYWFADAHQDTFAVMRFVKYWSCIEGFFSITQEDITESLAVGMAAVLTYGGYGFLERSAYRETKKRLKHLYGHRSTAVHRASHDHVTERDAALLSQWTAWLILTMAALNKEGRGSLSEILQVARQIDASQDAREQ